MKNKLMMTMGLGAIAFGFAMFGGHAINSHASELDGPTINLHEGEKPVRVEVDSETGIKVEAYVAEDAVPTSPLQKQAMALTSGWDLVGTEYWLLDGNLSSDQYDSIHYSTGGDYMFRVPAFTGYTKALIGFYGNVRLWENDPNFNADEHVVDWTFYPEDTAMDYIVRDIGKFVDGDNNKAEFYTIHSANFINKNTSDGRINDVKYYD